MLFVIIGAYIVVQFSWWAWLLLRHNAEVMRLQQQIIADGGVPEVPVRMAERTFWMVIGEGTVFLVLLLVALWLTYRTLKHELRLARQQRDFLLATSHELRTPIAGLKLHLQTMQRQDLEHAQRMALAAKAVDDLGRFSALIEKVLLATRLDETSPGLVISAFDANAELRSICEQLAAGTGARHRILPPPTGVRTLLSDPTAFRSVAMNLLENACKYAPEGTTISVTLEDTPGGLELEVADEGPGVEPDDQARIFEKFYRAGDETTRATQGTGLGLYIARRLMTGLGGRLEYRDAATPGAIFAATFPDR